MDVDALRALMLQLDWGVDEALDPVPIDRLGPVTAIPAQAPAPAALSRPNGARPREPQPREPQPRELKPRELKPSGVRAAREHAAPLEAPEPAAIGSLDELRAALERFEGCALRDTATATVVAEGGAASGLLFIYGAPSDADDRSGRPLSGPAARFFHAILASMGLDRPAVLVAPAIPWRPPGGRPPSHAELAECLPFLHQLILLARPRLLILMGTLPSRALLGPDRRPRVQLTRAAIPNGPDPIACALIPSVEDLVRAPDLRPAAWGALRQVMRLLRSTNTGS